MTKCASPSLSNYSLFAWRLQQQARKGKHTYTFLFLLVEKKGERRGNFFELSCLMHQTREIKKKSRVSLMFCKHDSPKPETVFVIWENVFSPTFKPSESGWSPEPLRCCGDGQWHQEGCCSSWSSPCRRRKLTWERQINALGECKQNFSFLFFFFRSHLDESS